MRHLLAVAALFAACHALGQSGNRITESAPAPSRWQQEQDALDQALRARVLGSTEPRALWIAGQLDAVDPWSQVASLAQARINAPAEKVYLASLALACLAPMQPLPPACDATDRLADWATRDADNGLPALLLAERARRRNNTASMVAFLEEAATRPRFDDYGNRGALLRWEALGTLDLRVEPAARAELAAAYAAARASLAAERVDALCREARSAPDTVRAACVGAGAAMAERAATWPLRNAGARLAERAGVPERLAEVQRRAAPCAEASAAVAAGLESPDAAVRAKAVAQWEALLARAAQVGEVAACGS